ncbi:hypothetical protein [Calothrix sp. NIES-2098]
MSTTGYAYAPNTPKISQGAIAFQTTSNIKRSLLSVEIMQG